jgi:hypothetical protein
MILSRRIVFLLIVGTIAFLEGYYLGPIGGLGWVIGASALTIILAIGWMRSYWSGSCLLR